MKNRKKWLLGTLLSAALLLLSGCVKLDSKGAPTGEGWMYNYLVHPVMNGIQYLAEQFNGSYGIAIILITIVVRIIILPLNLSQSKKAMKQTEKTTLLKPQIDAIQAKMKSAASQEDQMQASQEMREFYKENEISMTGGIGCLPLLIQMPIFTALFYAVKFAPGILESSFLGVNLGERSYIFLALAGLIYLGQGFISMIGVPEEQKKMMWSTALMSPLMIIFISFKAPAGVTLYWVIGGIFGCIQTLISNLYYKPKIKADIAEQMKKNPPRKIVVPVVQPKEPVKTATKSTFQANPNGKGRNAGKQQKRK